MIGIALSEKHIIGMKRKKIAIVTMLNFRFRSKGPIVNRIAHILINVLYPKYLENFIARRTSKDAGMMTKTISKELVLFVT